MLISEASRFALQSVSNTNSNIQVLHVGVELFFMSVSI